jgi:hypothetical protein
MRCFSENAGKVVDIRIANESANKRHYVLLAAHTLTAVSESVEDEITYDYYALISKDGNGNVVQQEGCVFLGFDRSGNIMEFDGEFNVTDRRPLRVNRRSYRTSLRKMMKADMP